MAENRYSIWSLLRNAWSFHENWQAAWRSPAPASEYDAVIVGGGGHGLAAAYYLAKEFAIRRIAVLERGWIGGGNSGRNTQVVRSNYYYPESARLYEDSLRRYETMGRDLGFNVMLRQSGHVRLIHDAHDLEAARNAANAALLSGIAAEFIGNDELQRMVPCLNLSPTCRFPVQGALVQRRGGIARHDAVVWAYARAADMAGVDIIQQCEVTGILRDGNGVCGVETTQGTIRARRVGISVAGNSGVLAGLAGFHLPIESSALQAMVTEPLKPLFDSVVSSGRIHVYVSQSDRGELVIGAGTDMHPSYAQRGDFAVTRETIRALTELFPIFSRLRLMRQWSGTVDITPDRSPLLGACPLPGVVLNCGWGTGGFKAIPTAGFLLAHHLAVGSPHELAAPFNLSRFSEGRLIDESAAAGVAH